MLRRVYYSVAVVAFTVLGIFNAALCVFGDDKVAGAWAIAALAIGMVYDLKLDRLEDSSP